MPEALGLEGKQIVVTGGTGALGAAVVEAFRDAGATCYLPVRDSKPTSQASVKVVPGVDLSSETAVRGFYAGLPPIWASVHLAGGFAASPLLETSLDDLRRMLDLNLVTAFLCCREAVRKMGGSGGRIVNTVARAALEPPGGMSAYVASKAALVAVTQSLAKELQPAGILVNAVAPSLIDTPANRAAMPGAAHDRWPKPAEIAAAILWIASPVNRLTSGAVVPVYGSA